MNQSFTLDIPEDAWEENGPSQDKAAHLCIGPVRLTIAGAGMFLSAYAVREDEERGYVSDVPDDAEFSFDDEIDAIYTLRGDDAPDPVLIRGRWYVLAAYPAG